MATVQTHKAGAVAEEAAMDDGAQVHIVVKEDPLKLNALKLDIGVWAFPAEDAILPAPKAGSKVFCYKDDGEDKWFWIGTMTSIEYA